MAAPGEDFGSRFIDYFLVCGLGFKSQPVELRGRFHTVKQTAAELLDLPPVVASVVDRFPPTDHDDFKVPEMIQSVVLPDGVRSYSSGPSLDDEDSLPKCFPVTLTEATGSKVYVAALSFRDKVDPLVAEHHGISVDSYVDKCICIVSRLSFVEQYVAILEDINRIQSCGAEDEKRHVWDVISDLASITVPRCGMTTIFTIAGRQYTISQPPQSLSRQPYVSYLPLIESLSIHNTIELYKAVLLERKILILSSNRRQLTMVAEALVSLMHPLQWLPVYVPVLPVNALECLDAPVPFLYGVSTEAMDLSCEEFEDVLVADLDKGTILQSGRQTTNQQQYGQRASDSELPSLPKQMEKKLAKALSFLIHPGSPTRMALSHACCKDDTSYQQLYAHLHGKPWGPRHDDMFQLAFIRCTASLLRGYREFLVQQAPRKSFGSCFQTEAFLFQKLEMDGAQVTSFLQRMLQRYALPAFLADQAAAGDSTLSLFDEVMSALDTPNELRVTFAPPESRSSTFITLPGISTTADDDKKVLSSVFSTCDHFPYSEASIVCQERCKRESQRARRVSTLAMKERESEVEAARLDILSKLTHYLRSLADTPSEEHKARVLAAMATAGEMSIPVRELVPFIEDSTLSREQSDRSELSWESFEALSSVLLSALRLAEQQQDYSSAATLVGISRRLYARTTDEETVHMASTFRSLGFWHMPEVWASFFQQAKLTLDEEDDDSGSTFFALKEVLRIMALVGLSEADVIKQVGKLSAGLPLQLQALLHDQFAQMQVLMHPQARHIASFLAGFNLDSGSAGKRKSRSPVAASRWSKAVSAVKREIRL